MLLSRPLVAAAVALLALMLALFTGENSATSQYQSQYPQIHDELAEEWLMTPENQVQEIGDYIEDYFEGRGFLSPLKSVARQAVDGLGSGVGIVVVSLGLLATYAFNFFVLNTRQNELCDVIDFIANIPVSSGTTTVSNGTTITDDSATMVNMIITAANNNRCS